MFLKFVVVALAFKSSFLVFPDRDTKFLKFNLFLKFYLMAALIVEWFLIFYCGMKNLLIFWANPGLPLIQMAPHILTITQISQKV